jgi:hypothetical protein
MADDAARVYFPFIHNWQAKYVARREFSTEIITSEAGVEQRRSWRTTPRRTVRMSCLVALSDFRRFQRLVAASQNVPVIIPDLTRATTLSSNAAAGATTIQCHPAAWLHDGLELIIDDGAAGDVTKISTIVSSSINLAVPIPAKLAGTMVRPALTAFWPQSFSLKMLTDSICSVDLDFKVDPVKELLRPSLAGATFNELEVFPFPANWRTALDVSWQWPVHIVDYERGPINQFRQIDFPTTIRSSEHLFASADEAQQLVDFFDRMKGRRGTFYLASGTGDMVMSSPVSSGDGMLFVEGHELANDFDEHPVFRAIQIELNDGSTFRRNVTNIVTSFENSRLNLDTPVNVALSPSDVAKISWLTLSRFATDALEMSYVTDQIATASTTVQSLPDQQLDYTDLRSTLEGDDRETIPGDDRVVFRF